VVVYTDSNTPNWGEKDCEGKPTEDPALSDKDKELLETLKSHPMNITKPPGDMGPISQLSKHYVAAGMQYWHFDVYKEYMCRGPYVANWVILS
jgi:hypothetical protein